MVLQMCHQLRRDAVPLVDAFNYPDFLLNSPLGRYDGDIYTHYFARVVARNPPVHPPPYFQQHIVPILTRQPDDDGEPEDEEDEEQEE